MMKMKDLNNKYKTHEILKIIKILNDLQFIQILRTSLGSKEIREQIDMITVPDYYNTSKSIADRGMTCPCSFVGGCRDCFARGPIEERFECILDNNETFQYKWEEEIKPAFLFYIDNILQDEHNGDLCNYE